MTHKKVDDRLPQFKGVGLATDDVSAHPSDTMIRVVSYNVCRFVHAKNSESTAAAPLQAMARALERIGEPGRSADIYCLNEVDLSIPIPGYDDEPPTSMGDSLETLRTDALAEHCAKGAEGEDVTCFAHSGEDILSAFARVLTEEASDRQFTPFFHGHVAGRYGNAVLVDTSRFHVVDGEKFHLPGGTSIVNSRTGDPHRIARGMLKLVLEVKEKPGSSGDTAPDAEKPARFSVYNTHLDHIQQKERVVQLGFVREQMERERRRSEKGVDFQLLCGDFNAMRRGDYSAGERETLEKRNADRGWGELPFGELEEVLGLRNPSRRNGFVDCFADFCEGGLVKPVEEMFPWQKFTSNLDARIDYIFLGRSGCEGGNAPAKESSVQVCKAEVWNDVGFSDHFPLAVEVRAS